MEFRFTIRDLLWVVVVVALASTSASCAEPRPHDAKAPKAAKTRDDILAAVEQIQGFGNVEWTETNRWDRRIFVVWYCPFSGRAAVYVHAYYFNDKGWHLFWDTLLDGTSDLSVELPADQDVMRCRGADGAIVHTEPLSKVPKYYGTTNSNSTLKP